MRMTEDELVKAQADHLREMAKIDKAKAKWNKSPALYLLNELLEGIIIISVILLIAQCSCNCIIK